MTTNPRFERLLRISELKYCVFADYFAPFLAISSS